MVGQNRVTKNNINIVKNFSNPQIYNVNPLVSKSTIRELSEAPRHEGAVRILVLIMEIDFINVLHSEQNQ